MTIEEQFLTAMQAAGLEPDCSIVADGKLHRFRDRQDKAGSRNGYYTLFSDGIPSGSFGSWKLDIKETWSATPEKAMTIEQRKQWRERIARAREEREKAEEEQRAECRKWCGKTCKTAKDATDDHPYLQRKGVHSYGLKCLRNSLIIPVKDMAGTIHGVQFIRPDGDRKFKAGSAKTGHFFTIGKAKDNTVIVCEGYATGASIHQATGRCVIVAFDVRNLQPVAEVIRAARPEIKIIIAADNDAWKKEKQEDGTFIYLDAKPEENTGIIDATKAACAVGGYLAKPTFQDTTNRPTDFNDLHLAEGLGRVKEYIEAAQPVPPPSSPNNIPPDAKIESPAEKSSTDKAPAETGHDEPPADNQVAPADTWDAPLLFGEIDTPEIPAHLLPGYLGEFCQAVSDATQTPPGLAVMFALAAVAACLAKRFEVSPYGEEYFEPVNVWTVTALDPGNRKTAVKTAITAPLTEWEQEEAARLRPDIKRIKHQREINQKAIDQIKARAAKADTSAAGRDELLKEITEIEEDTPDELIAPRLWTDDTTPERLQSLLLDHGERMALLSDESGVFEVMGGLYSGGKANLNVFLQGHAGSSVRVDRQGRTVMLHRPALTFGLTVQPDVIADLGKGNKTCFRGNGTLARFLYCLPKSRIGTRDVTQRVVIAKEVKEAYRAGIMNLLAIEPDLDSKGKEKARILILDTGALEAWHQFSQYIEDRQGPDGEFYSFQDWTSKLPGAALRIAGLFHVVEHGAEVSTINAQTIERALDLCELLITHAQTAFETMGSEPAQNDAQIVLRWIIATGKPSFRQNEAIKSMRQFRTVDRLEKALKILTARNIISEPFKRNSGGRPSVLYAVNPAILHPAQVKAG
ncbi:DUF3987 domain-containing protein [Geotalea sp. SG265]|uniref:DUF3987 domain-containing protein n=1 Tax=Geotalea sp. SG265 TaxID=2922867 RepID=UPI001FAF0B54|nr:DUF3987 domain-containing protein [Geotalea sp. SG265]